MSSLLPEPDSQDEPQVTTTRKETFDILTWDEAETYAEVRQWPTYSHRRLVFHSLDRGNKPWPPSFYLSDILRWGWEPVGMTLRRHGFLWLQESKVWTLTKRIEWTQRTGPDGGSSGERVTPSMETLLKNSTDYKLYNW